MDSIQRSIRPEAVTGFKRLGVHESFVIFPNLEMVQQVRVVTVDENGVPIRERIIADEALDPVQKHNAFMRYQDQLIQKQTEGSFVDLAGNVVAADTEGAITQKKFFQDITFGQLKAMGISVTDEATFSSVLYALIASEIDKINARGGL